MNTQTKTPANKEDVPSVSHAELSQCLSVLNADAGASEIHGQLVGLLCAQGNVPDAQWIKYAISGVTEGDTKLVVSKEQVMNLLAIKKATLASLNNSELELELLLPEPEDGDSVQVLGEQVTALSEWCQGFLFGLSQGGVEDIQSLPDDASEVVLDMVEVSELSDEGLDDAEAHVQFMEVMEFVRVGAMLVNEELHPLRHKKIDTEGYDQVDIFGEDIDQTLDENFTPKPIPESKTHQNNANDSGQYGHGDAQGDRHDDGHDCACCASPYPPVE